MREGDTIGGHDSDDDNADERKLRVDALLIEADKARQCDDQQAKGIAIVEVVGRAGG
jgi:hypothetical protein